LKNFKRDHSGFPEHAHVWMTPVSRGDFFTFQSRSSPRLKKFKRDQQGRLKFFDRDRSGCPVLLRLDPAVMVNKNWLTENTGWFGRGT
jgi:hypothetical protein